MTIAKRAKRILYFDDDMHVDDLRMDHEFFVPGIQGIPIMGCPDLSRFEWMQLYLRFFAKRSDKERADQSLYADELMSKYGQNIV